MENTTNIVFGTGICLQNNWRLIVKYFKPKYLSDNAIDKWHTYPMKDFPEGDKIECISPKKIAELPNPYVMITIGDPYVVEAVRKQMAAMDIPCGAVVDCLEQWGKKEPFPKRLHVLENMQGHPRIFIFNSPEHDNVGDHLISIAELQFIKKYFPDFTCVEITDIEYLWFHSRIREYVKQDDLILISGGGFLGSLWLYNGELNVRNILQEYPQNKVVIMPQTCFFEENERGRNERIKTAELYKKHENLTICLREKNSFRLMSGLLGEDRRIALIPDMALFLDYSKKQEQRKGVLLCLRQDKESVLGKEQMEKIIVCMQRSESEFRYTLMHTGNCYNIEGREEVIEKKAAQMKSAELVITDTLHAMILCTITGTPCLAFDNISHKVSGVYEWIKQIPYIHFYRKEENLQECINELRKQGKGHYDKKPLMSFYEKLARIIRED